MKKITGFKTKLLVVFLLLSVTPLIVAITWNAINMVSDAQKNVEREIELRNSLVQMKITELYEKNFNVLRVLAVSPNLQNFLLNPSDQNKSLLEPVIIKINALFHDSNQIVVTDKFAQQKIRSDGLPYVNVSQRSYYYEAMSGREFISEVIVSLTTNRFISVIEVPVLGQDGRPIGFLQRNYDLIELQDFVHNLSDPSTQVIILDKDGKIVAHSSRTMKTEEDRTDESKYEFVGKALAGMYGSIRTNFEGEDSFIYYSRNKTTNWAVIVVHPSKYTVSQIYGRAVLACGFGIVLLLIIVAIAYVLTDKISRPLISLNKAILEVASGSHSEKSHKNLKGDELQQMVAAFGEIKETTHHLKLASETDKLTQLLNKGATQNYCMVALQNVLSNSNSTADIIAALFIVDLDHFKRANDTYGHHHGDLILQEFAKKLKAVFREKDCVGRFGGDEFIVFIMNIPNIEIVIKKACQILNTARSLTVENRNAEISASVGIAIAPRDGTDYKTLFDYADKCLYCVKKEGRNGYCIDGENVVH